MILLRRFFPAILFSLVVLISCGAMGSDPAEPEGHDTEDILAALEAAERGDYHLIDSFGFHGGDGAWFILAEVAYEAGFDNASLYALGKSRENDPHPYNTRALTSLLIRDPAALKRPLALLERAEKAHGAIPEIRMARIVVLEYLEKDSQLLKEYSIFSGLPGEAPVLAAALAEDPGNLSLQAVAERYILHCSDPSVLTKLPADAVASLGLGAPYLFGARSSFSQGLYKEALEEYRLWIDVSLAEGAPCDLEDPPPVFTEIAEAAIRSGNTETWANYLSAVAPEFGGAKRFGAAFQAGKLKRELGEYSEAALDFSLAAGALPKGLQRDRALWYRLRVSYQSNRLTSEEEMALWLSTWSEWDDPERFDDQLLEFLYRRVRSGEWTDLERIYRDRGELWPASVRAQISLVLGFAAAEGRLSGSVAAGDYFEEAIDANPVSWAGMRAAGLLGRNLVISEESWVSPEPEAPFEDLVVNGLLDWGFTSQAYRILMDNPGAYSAGTQRALSRALAPDYPRLSIRVIGQLWGFEGYRPDRADLILRHPLPYGDMAAGYAEKEGVPPEIFHGLIRTESAWDAVAISRSGAMGLSQFMPPTWAEWVRRMNYPPDADPTDPETNAALGAAYLDWLHDREWTWGWIDSLASYNAGGGRVRSWRRERPGLGNDLFGESIPVEEPRSYIRKVLSAATLYGYLYAGESPAGLHEKWGLEMIKVD